MKKIDLKGNPFYLEDTDIQWVEKTKKNMTIEEKIGQLFFLMGFTTNKKELAKTVETIKPGGMMYRTTTVKKLNAVYEVLQGKSDIPMLLAANLEAGGNGLIDEGTNFGHQLLVAASDNVENAYRLGLISGREGASVGANMAFAPILDINYNFRNPITNIRSFGDHPDRVAKMGAAYVRGARDAGISVTIKHFPGDGTDGRDQHLVTTSNHLNVGDWMKSFGHAYKESIEIGALGLMVGHIAFPKYFEEKYPEHMALKAMPATLNPILLNQLLREELGYNGLTMTDASLMTGFGEKGRREDLVPQSIAAGCDMFLFTRSPQDDYQYMMAGYRKGIITDARLDEALTRILATKAALGLHQKTKAQLVPNAFHQVNVAEHQAWAKDLADEGITLVKDDQHILPLSPTKHKKIGVLYNGNGAGMAELFKNVKGLKGALMRTAMTAMSMGKRELKPYEKLIKELNNNGFEAFFYDFGDIFAVMKDTNRPLAEWSAQFDAIIYLAKWETMSNQTSLQLQYKAMGFDAPWFIHEVPTILVSLASPYHGYDLPMIPTVINAYSPTEPIYKAVVDKLMGRSVFKGISPVRLDFKEFSGSIE